MPKSVNKTATKKTASRPSSSKTASRPSSSKTASKSKRSSRPSSKSSSNTSSAKKAHRKHAHKKHGGARCPFCAQRGGVTVATIVEVLTAANFAEKFELNPIATLKKLNDSSFNSVATAVTDVNQLEYNHYGFKPMDTKPQEDILPHYMHHIDEIKAIAIEGINAKTVMNAYVRGEFLSFSMDTPINGLTLEEMQNTLQDDIKTYLKSLAGRDAQSPTSENRAKLLTMMYAKGTFGRTNTLSGAVSTWVPKNKNPFSNGLKDEEIAILKSVGSTKSEAELSGKDILIELSKDNKYKVMKTDVLQKIVGEGNVSIDFIAKALSKYKLKNPAPTINWTSVLTQSKLEFVKDMFETDIDMFMKAVPDNITASDNVTEWKYLDGDNFLVDPPVVDPPAVDPLAVVRPVTTSAPVLTVVTGNPIPVTTFIETIKSHTIGNEGILNLIDDFVLPTTPFPDLSFESEKQPYTKFTGRAFGYFERFLQNFVAAAKHGGEEQMKTLMSVYTNKEGKFKDDFKSLFKTATGSSAFKGADTLAGISNLDPSEIQSGFNNAVVAAYGDRLNGLLTGDKTAFAGGRLRTVHRGTRGGQYVVVKGKKVYL